MCSGRPSSSPGQRLRRQLPCLLGTVFLLPVAGCSIDTALTPPAYVGSVGSITPSYGDAPAVQAAPASFEPASDEFPLAAPAVSSGPSPQPLAMPQSGEVAATAAPSAPGSAGVSAEPVSGGEGDRVVEVDTRDPVVAGVGTAAPRLVAGTGLGNPDARQAKPLLPQTARRPAAPAAGENVQVAFNLRPADPRAMGRSSAPQPDATAPRDLMPASEMACRRELRRLGVRFADLPRISDGPSCGIAYPVKVTGLSGGIRIKPAATLNCHVTAEFAKWVKSDVAPAARMRYLSGIKSITQLSSYSCRTMNSQPGAPMSEHAHGNAIDVGSITLNSGRKIDVRKPGWFAFRQRGFLNTIRAESCSHFDTVLGPGTNKYHWNHFHFDLRQRKSGRSYCE